MVEPDHAVSVGAQLRQPIKGICKICFRSIRGSRRVKSNFICHLRRCHPGTFEEFEVLSGRKATSPAAGLTADTLTAMSVDGHFSTAYSQPPSLQPGVQSTPITLPGTSAAGLDMHSSPIIPQRHPPGLSAPVFPASSTVTTDGRLAISSPLISSASSSAAVKAEMGLRHNPNMFLSDRMEFLPSLVSPDVKKSSFPPPTPALAAVVASTVSSPPPALQLESSQQNEIVKEAMIDFIVGTYFCYFITFLFIASLKISGFRINKHL